MRIGKKKKKQPSTAVATTGDVDPGNAARALSQALERGSRLQQPAVENYVNKLRAKYPNDPPAAIVTKIERRYRAAVIASGAAVGSAAAVPAVGTFAAMTVVAGETVVFLEATALYVLALAEIYGIPAHNFERRKALVLAVLTGEEGKHALTELLGAGRTNGAWLVEGAAAVPMASVAQLNTRLTRYFIRKFTVKRGALAFGKLMPIGIGAAIGGLGNRMMSHKIIDNAREAFGPAPQYWPSNLQVVQGYDVNDGRNVSEPDRRVIADPDITTALPQQAPQSHPDGDHDTTTRLQPYQGPITYQSQDYPAPTTNPYQPPEHYQRPPTSYPYRPQNPPGKG